MADRNSLFYPDQNGPYPSVRLKGFRRAQQDIEYMTLLALNKNLPHHVLKGWLREASNGLINPGLGFYISDGENYVKEINSVALPLYFSNSSSLRLNS